MSGTTSSPSSSGTGGSNSDGGNNGGLSSGAKAGIGIAVAIGVIGICCFVAAFLFYRKRRNIPSKRHEDASTLSDYYAQSPTAQYGGVPKVEMYRDTQHTTQHYMALAEVSSESRPAPAVEIG